MGTLLPGSPHLLIEDCFVEGLWHMCERWRPDEQLRTTCSSVLITGDSVFLSTSAHRALCLRILLSYRMVGAWEKGRQSDGAGG